MVLPLYFVCALSTVRSFVLSDIFVLTKGRIAQGERGLNGSRLRCHLIAGVGG